MPMFSRDLKPRPKPALMVAVEAHIANLDGNTTAAAVAAGRSFARGQQQLLRAMNPREV